MPDKTEKSSWELSAGMRVLFLLCAAYFVYAGYRYLSVEENGDYTSAFWVIHAPIHEVGHLFFTTSFFPQTLGVAAGTIFQCLTPIVCGFYFVRRKEYPVLAVMTGWFGFTLLDVSIYMRDARLLKMPLTSPFAHGGEVIHDWSFLFERMDLLPQAYAIANVTAVVGYAVLALSVLWILFLCLFYKVRPESRGPGKSESRPDRTRQ